MNNNLTLEKLRSMRLLVCTTLLKHRLKTP